MEHNNGSAAASESETAQSDSDTADIAEDDLSDTNTENDSRIHTHEQKLFWIQSFISQFKLGAG